MRDTGHRRGMRERDNVESMGTEILIGVGNRSWIFAAAFGSSSFRIFFVLMFFILARDGEAYFDIWR